jgi:uncharacterized membrane protein
MDDVMEWIRSIVRWAHIFAAILWIGQTWLFHWFEKNLTREGELAEHVIGNVWMVHGGGYYVVEKQKFPRVMPRTLHWFRWEAGITWITGILLIALTYYFGGLLVEPEMNYNVGAAAGVAAIILSWVVYDLLIRTPLRKNEIAFAVVGLVLIVASTYGLGRVLSSRAVYIHIGAMVGTVMAGNVWMRIIPSQRKILALTQAGKPVDESLAATGPIRSKHNSYMVVPLIFIMISNHYPTISYANPYSWAVIGGVFVAGWLAAGVLRQMR